MGYMQHRTIIVTAWEKHIHLIRRKALEIFPKCLVSNIMNPKLNSDAFLCIASDGSKEGWDESNIGDKRRDAFMKWLDAERISDRLCVSYIEVQNYDDGQRRRITRRSK